MDKEIKKPDYAKMNIYQKLIEVKKHIKGLSKDGSSGSGSFGYKYITPSKVDSVLNPLLNEFGLYLTKQMTSVNRVEYERKTNNGKTVIENLYEVHFLMTWINTDKPEEKIELPWFASGVNGTEKGLGSSITYATRYFKLSQFDIPSDQDDVDALEHVELEKKAKALDKVRDDEKDTLERIGVKMNPLDTLEGLDAFKQAINKMSPPLPIETKKKVDALFFGKEQYILEQGGDGLEVT